VDEEPAPGVAAAVVVAADGPVGDEPDVVDPEVEPQPATRPPTVTRAATARAVRGRAGMTELLLAGVTIRTAVAARREGCCRGADGLIRACSDQKQGIRGGGSGREIKDAHHGRYCSAR
jgi:hypothetical protein